MGKWWIPGVGALAALVACSTGDGSSVASSVQASETTSVVPTTGVEWTRPPTASTPPGVIAVAPGESIQEAVDSAEEGSVFLLEAGLHRLQQVDPKSRQRFLGESGAVLNGSILLTDFSRRDDVWVHQGVNAQGEERGTCVSEESTCRFPEDLFFDGRRIQRVRSPEEVEPGSWYLDYPTDTVYLGEDPSDVEVEVSVLPYAFGGDGTDVTIDGLVIEKYASPAQRGAILGGRGWQILGNEIRWNHGGGLRAGSELLVADNYFHHNGQFGIEGGGVGSVYERNEIAYNHLGDFSFRWGAGGVKFVHTTRLVMRNNYVHDNRGPGLWIDGHNTDTTFEANRVIDNFDSGIKVELSGSGRIADNTVRGNGFGNTNRMRAAGIMVRESGPVDVFGNRLENNVESLILHHDEERDETGNHLHGVHVHANDIVLDGLVGYFGDIPFDAFHSAGLVFEDNTYTGSMHDREFLDHGVRVNFKEWQERGLDSGSTIEER